MRYLLPPRESARLTKVLSDVLPELENMARETGRTVPYVTLRVAERIVRTLVRGEKAHASFATHVLVWSGDAGTRHIPDFNMLVHGSNTLDPGDDVTGWPVSQGGLQTTAVTISNQVAEFFGGLPPATTPKIIYDRLNKNRSNLYNFGRIRTNFIFDFEGDGYLLQVDTVRVDGDFAA